MYQPLQRHSMTHHFPVPSPACNASHSLRRVPIIAFRTGTHLRLAAMRLRPIPTKLVADRKILSPIFSTISKCARSAPDWIVAPCDRKLGQSEDEQDPECAWQTRRATDMVPQAASRRYENDSTEFQKSTLMLSMH